MSIPICAAISAFISVACQPAEFCFHAPAPPATEIDAYEAWLDDFARAWLADADERARRRLARFAS